MKEFNETISCTSTLSRWNISRNSSSDPKEVHAETMSEESIDEENCLNALPFNEFYDVSIIVDEINQMEVTDALDAWKCWHMKCWHMVKHDAWKLNTHLQWQIKILTLWLLIKVFLYKIGDQIFLTPSHKYF